MNKPWQCRRSRRGAVKARTITIRHAKSRRKWTEKELLKGVTPDICGPDLIPDRTGKELL